MLTKLKKGDVFLLNYTHDLSYIDIPKISRPYVVISCDTYNRSNDRVVAVPITHSDKSTSFKQGFKMPNENVFSYVCFTEPRTIYKDDIYKVIKHINLDKNTLKFLYVD